MDDNARVPHAAELHSICLDLAVGGAELVRRTRGNIRSVAAKSTATDLVTDVDRACEAWLLAELAARRPGDAVLAEEGGAHAGSTAVRWLLDPIDGTVNFVLGLPLYAVSVAAEVAGEVLAGAVANPASGEVFSAARGSGAQLGTSLDVGAPMTRLVGPRDVPLARAVVGTGFGYDVAQRTRQMRVAAELSHHVADIRRMGSAALDLCFLAAGRLDAYFEAGLNPWDYAAGALIATEAGCTVGGLHGAAHGPAMVAATRSGLAPDFFTLLESLGADAVVV